MPKEPAPMTLTRVFTAFGAYVFSPFEMWAFRIAYPDRYAEEMRLFAEKQTEQDWLDSRQPPAS